MNFKHMTPEQRSAIASRGGKKAQAGERAHRWTVEDAKAAGRKGGNRAAANRAAVRRAKNPNARDIDE